MILAAAADGVPSREGSRVPAAVDSLTVGDGGRVDWDAAVARGGGVADASTQAPNDPVWTGSTIFPRPMWWWSLAVAFVEGRKRRVADEISSLVLCWPTAMPGGVTLPPPAANAPCWEVLIRSRSETPGRHNDEALDVGDSPFVGDMTGAAVRAPLPNGAVVPRE